MAISALAAGLLGLGGLISGGLGLTSAIINQNAQKKANEANYLIHQQDMDFNAAQAQLGRDFTHSENQAYYDWQSNENALNRAFQEDMAKNAYQYKVADLQAAGLNPYLAINGGASVPVGSSTGSSGNTSTGVASIGSGANQQAAGLDLSGLANTITSFTNLLLISKIAGNKGVNSAFNPNKDPSWLKKYMENPDLGVRDL